MRRRIAFRLVGAVAVASALGVGCGLTAGDFATESLGTSCRGGSGDRFNVAYYFEAVAGVQRFGTQAVAEAVRSGEQDDDGAVDVSVLLGSPSPEVLYSGDDLTDAIQVLMAPELVNDARRLPEEGSVLLAVSNSYRPGEVWVAMIAIVDDESGDLQFIGECAKRFQGDPLMGFRDAVFPGERLDDLFLSVVADEEIWLIFSDWEMERGS